MTNRIHFSTITNASYLPQWLTGRLRLDLEEEQFLALEVVRSFEKQAKVIASIFGKGPL